MVIIRRGGFKGSNIGMSRPFGHRPSYSGRRYINRAPGWGHPGYGPDVGSWCCFLLCIYSLISDSSTSRSMYGPHSYDGGYYGTTNSSSNTQADTTRISSFCPNCNASMNPEDRFCQNCGFKRE